MPEAASFLKDLWHGNIDAMAGEMGQIRRALRKHARQLNCMLTMASQVHADYGQLASAMHVHAWNVIACVNARSTACVSTCPTCDRMRGAPVDTNDESTCLTGV